MLFKNVELCYSSDWGKEPSWVCWWMVGIHSLDTSRTTLVMALDRYFTKNLHVSNRERINESVFYILSTLLFILLWILISHTLLSNVILGITITVIYLMVNNSCVSNKNVKHMYLNIKQYTQFAAASFWLLSVCFW